MAEGELRTPEREVSGFNPIEAAIGVIIRPARAMQQIAAARPWPVAMLLASAIALLTGLVNLTAPMPAMAGGEPLPPGLPGGFETILAFTRSPWLPVVSALVITPLTLLISTSIFYLVGRLLGGHGPFSALLATQGFATVPGILLAPLMALLNLGGTLLAFVLLGYAVSVGFGIWVLVLQVLGIRESLALSTGRAVAVLLIPIAVLILLGCLLGILVVVLVAAGMNSMGG